jgi:hypothetical protein
MCGTVQAQIAVFGVNVRSSFFHASADRVREPFLRCS